MLRIFIPLTVLTLLVRPASAQVPNNANFEADPKQTSYISDQHNELFWGTIGVGAVGPGIGGLLKATYAWGHSSISAKVEGGSEFRISIFGKAPQNEVTELSIYYGMQSIAEWTILRVAAGPAYFVRVDDPEPTFYRFGIGAEAEAMAKIGPVGLSLMGSLMVAQDIFFGGITVNISLGKLE